MTERKPREISFASWVDQQVSEAAERGAFDNLPGAGKPISRRGGTDAWLQDYLRREGVSADELLPTPLRLRKEIERLTETVQDLHSEDEVRQVVKGLNRRIAEWRRIPDGPPVYLRLVDEEIARRFTQVAKSHGIEILTGSDVVSMAESDRERSESGGLKVTIKNTASAKQRLASVLDQPARTQLAQEMLTDVLTRVLAARP